MAQVLMKAVLLRGYGDVSQLSYEDVPEPLAAAGEVLVKTIAVSINPSTGNCVAVISRR